jgi:hypothetical protein
LHGLVICPADGGVYGRESGMCLGIVDAATALLAPGDAYSIFQHGPIISNDGTIQFVVELKRRAQLAGASLEDWFGIKEGTQEAIIAKFKSQSEGKPRWPGLW